MTKITDNKAQVKSWLLHLLAELEIAKDVEGERKESSFNHIIIELQLKY